MSVLPRLLSHSGLHQPPRHAETPPLPHRAHRPAPPPPGTRASRHTVRRKVATSPRTPYPAHEGDRRHPKRRPDAKRDSAGHMGTLWCSPLHRIEASQLVSWRLKKSLPCFRRSSQPPLGLQLQARGSSAAARPFRRARSARAARRHLDAVVLLRSATFCKFVEGRPPGGLHTY